eukprot:TRINITY_DN7643_c0_g1_i1.p1 TRINITY_DN7643_c0_g1~~TRINITY_DN7643_c0_g1_i1.p1  ORF type:complete len:238 (+),score=59.34 TRINITY_DN7643_c0_g1_i1:212-925(+)
MYHLRRYYWEHPDGTPLEVRPPFVFALDLSKLGAGQAVGWAVNLFNTRRNALLEHSNIRDPLAWYFPTFLADELFAVPLGVGLGVLLCRSARHLRDHHHVRSCDALARFGRYQSDDAIALSPNLNWWVAQLLAWVLCVAVSRYVGGLLLPALEAILGQASPFHILAQWIYALQWSCAAKRLVFAGALRMLVDLAEISITDFFNKYVREYILAYGWREERTPLFPTSKAPTSAHSTAI